MADAVSGTLQDRETLLRIQNMNLYEIELNSRVECLAGFKGVYGRTFAAMTEILRSYSCKMTDEECETVCLTFFSFLFGVYPFVFHTEKQMEAMEIAGIRQADVTIRSIVYELLVRLIPDKK